MTSCLLKFIALFLWRQIYSPKALTASTRLMAAIRVRPSYCTWSHDGTWLILAWLLQMKMHLNYCGIKFLFSNPFVMSVCNRWSYSCREFSLLLVKLKLAKSMETVSTEVTERTRSWVEVAEMSFLCCVADRVVVLVKLCPPGGAQGRAAAPPHWEEPDEGARTPSQDASQTPPRLHTCLCCSQTPQPTFR